MPETPRSAPRATLRIATRSSAQARTQAEVIAAAIEAANADVVTELVFVDTVGDQRQDVPLHTIGGQGVFVKEVQRAVLDGRADIAVHSAKDLPSAPADGLTIGAFTVRRDARDALVGSSLDGLALGATVASGSVRRRAQLHALRPDLRFVELRGNIQTRLSKVPADGAIVMAVAALDILGLRDRIAEIVDVDAMVPAVGQGCVAVEHRTDDFATAAIVAAVDHAPTRRAVEAERAFLAELGTGCSLPIGAHVVDGQLIAFLADDRRALQTTVRLGHDWNSTAAETARGLQAELQP
ncbi:MAG: hemC [Ilumatobacteraceae bacterium]|nr:hemC [Ilumatobacteraceae bacterium]MCU1389946.1 hemC [Ilumatobacteraceae bacterium]